MDLIDSSVHGVKPYSDSLIQNACLSLTWCVSVLLFLLDAQLHTPS